MADRRWIAAVGALLYLVWMPWMVCAAAETPPETQTADRTEEKMLTLPYTAPDTEVEVETLASYEGPFLEENTDEPVSWIGAVILRSISKDQTQAGELVLERDGESYRFCFTDLLPGQRLMVLERNRKKIAPGGFDACRWESLSSESTNMAEDSLEIWESGDWSLSATNISDREIDAVELYFKNFDAGSGVYIGGITYSVTMESLAPGQTREVTPYRYVSGYSRLVEVRLRWNMEKNKPAMLGLEGPLIKRAVISELLKLI